MVCYIVPRSITVYVVPKSNLSPQDKSDFDFQFYQYYVASLEKGGPGMFAFPLFPGDEEPAIGSVLTVNIT
jgi:hypothetical protein